MKLEVSVHSPPQWKIKTQRHITYVLKMQNLSRSAKFSTSIGCRAVPGANYYEALTVTMSQTNL